MALTLLEAAKRNSGDAFRAAVITTFAQSHDFLGAMPFEDITGNAIKFNQEGALPTVGFRNINGSWTPAEGALSTLTESLFIGGGDLQVDPALETTMPGNRAAQEAMQIKAMGHNVATKLIRGDNVTTNSEPDGLEVRIPTTSAQAFDSAGASDALSLTQLDAAIDQVAEPTHLIMTRVMKRRLTNYLRSTAAGGFVYIEDDFGRQVMVYNDLPILIADKADYSQAALGHDEGTGATNAQSIYVVSFREGHMTGIQNGDIRARDLGETTTGAVALVTRVEWLVGFAMWHPRAAARVYDIDPAQAVIA